jgi:hypothetical protein
MEETEEKEALLACRQRRRCIEAAIAAEYTKRKWVK